MKEITNFLEKIKGSSSISCIISSINKFADIEKLIGDKGYIAVNNKVDFYTHVMNGSKIYISVYRQENLDDWYKMAEEYMSGQMYDLDLNKRVNFAHEKNSVIFLLDMETINKFANNILEQVGLTEQV